MIIFALFIVAAASLLTLALIVLLALWLDWLRHQLVCAVLQLAPRVRAGVLRLIPPTVRVRRGWEG